MSRIKWNLDKLEEVKKQHDEFMESTEDVINKGREDLASMTKEVWEGEDSDMARELYDKLVYKNMPDTYKQLETCNESIQKAQKQAYEAKNFCNGFPQIFRDGSMPSDADEAPCGGELMCDEGSCEQLISSMEAAGQNATNVKSKTEMVESILASLETDEAKFDYASYTEPIKKQAQNVVDRTRTFNVALSRYIQKVDDLDRTLENELLNATPAFVPEPFDPASIDLGELVHMGDGDIVNFLEEHDSVDISDTFEVSMIESILEKLFGKKNIDISKLSEEDFEIAFLKLSEADQRKVLLGLGLSKTQIDSILASKDSKKTFIDGLYRSTSMDKIRKMDRKMPQYNNFGKPKDKTGGSKEKAPTPSAQSSSGIVECDSPSIYTPYKLDPSSYESLYNDYVEATNMLCDDDPSNDADAIALMNETLQKGFYFQERDGVKYIMYDTDLLQYCMDNAEKGSLLYSLFDDFRNNIGDGTLSTYEGHGWIKEHSLEISQLGAGYQLVLNVDSEWGIWSEEINDMRVAYASTDTTVRNYFMDGDSYDWDAIIEWCRASESVTSAVEYDFLVNELLKMDDSDIEKFLADAQKPDWGDYTYMEQVAALMGYYEVRACEMSAETDDSRYYSRALCCSNVVSTVRDNDNIFFYKLVPDFDCKNSYRAYLTDNVSFSYTDIANGSGEKQLDVTTMDTIDVYPLLDPTDIDLLVHSKIKDIISPNFLGCSFSAADGCLQTFLDEKGVKLNGYLLSVYGAIKDYVDSYIAFKDVEGLADLATAVQMYGASGYMITKKIGFTQSSNVIVDHFDEYGIGAATILYNRYASLAGYGVATTMNNDHDYITTQELRDSFSEQNDIRDNYYEIYSDLEERAKIKKIYSTLQTIADCLYGGDDDDVDSNNVSASETSEMLSVYYTLENNLEGDKSLEELSQDQVKELYNKIYGG